MRRTPAVRWVLGASVALGVATMFAMPSVGSRVPVAALEAADEPSTVATETGTASDSAPPERRGVHGVLGVSIRTLLDTPQRPARAVGWISGTEPLTVADASGSIALRSPLAPLRAVPEAGLSGARPSAQPVMRAGAMAGGVLGAGMGMGGGGLGGAGSPSSAQPPAWARPSQPSARVDLPPSPVASTPPAPPAANPAPAADVPPPAANPAPAVDVPPLATNPAPAADVPPPVTPSATPAVTPPATPAATSQAVSTTPTSDTPAVPTSTAPASSSTAPTTSSSAGPAGSTSPAPTSTSTAGAPTTTSSGTSTPIASSTDTPSASSAPTSGTLSVVGRSVDLGPDARDIDLTASALHNGALITDQLLASQQVAFEGAAYFGTSAGAGAYNAFTALYGMPALQNGTSAAPTETLTIRFARPVRAVGFNLFAVQFDELALASGLASGPSFTVRYDDGGERRVERPVIEDPTLYRLLPPSQRPDPLWWVFEHGGLISSLTVHTPIYFSSQLGFDLDDVIGDLYLANLQVLDAIEPNIVVPEPSTLGLLGLGLAAFALLRRRR